MAALPEQIRELLERLKALKHEATAVRDARTPALNRLTALALMRRQMDRQLEENMADLKGTPCDGGSVNT
jgi:hypothetical protein